MLCFGSALPVFLGRIAETCCIIGNAAFLSQAVHSEPGCIGAYHTRIGSDCLCTFANRRLVAVVAVNDLVSVAFKSRTVRGD
jgi:hypothetical protein